MCQDEVLNTIKKYISRYKIKDRYTLIQYLSYCSIDFLENFKKGIPGQNFMVPWYTDFLALISFIFTHESKIHCGPLTIESLKYINHLYESCNKVLFKESWLIYFEDIKENSVFGPLLLQQRHYNEYIFAKLYRYYYFFNYDNKTNDFFNRKTSINNYIDLAIFATLPVILKKGFNDSNDFDSFCKYQKIIDFILDSNERVSNYLCIEYSTFKKWTEDKCDINNIVEIMYSYKVFNEKPILKMNEEKHIVCTHSLHYACTDGLFNVITYNENEIKDHFGKYVMEDYLYSIAKESELYELVDEKERRKRFGNKKIGGEPADLIFKNNKTVVIVESKECIHMRKSWINDRVAIDNEYRKCIQSANEIVKLYRNFKNGLYNPYCDKTDKEKEVFLVILTLQYFPYHRDKIIESVGKNKEEKEYLKKHLLITDFYSFEIYFLHKSDIISVLINYSRLGELDNFGLKGFSFLAKNRTKSFKDFINKLDKKVHNVLDNLALALSGLHINPYHNFDYL